MSKYKGLFTFDEDNHRYVPIAQADGIIDTMDYEPDSEPTEPLIKDEKIRKAGAIPTEFGYEGYPASICASIDDEVVHGKRSLLDRAPGEYEQKFAGTRAFLVYQMTYPGKKLTFMGNEIGQFTEWDHEKSVEWFLLDYGMHAAFQLFAANLNHFYLSHAALWQKDTDPSGFEWIDADNAEQSICSYRRIDEKGRELIVVINFTPVERSGFLLAVPYGGVYEEIFNSDDPRYGGGGVQNTGRLRSEPAILRAYRHAIRITLPASGALIFHCVRKTPKLKK